MTVVGLLAKMREAFQKTGGGRFILSSEEGEYTGGVAGEI